MEKEKQKTAVPIAIVMYLTAIVAANLLIVQFGPSVSIINAFLFIGLDITIRDYLHEEWQDNLWLKMLGLIFAGSILSYALNYEAANIAMASFSAFLLAGIADTLAYKLLGGKTKLVKINGSNVVSAAVDSLVFPIMAFGFPVLWWVVFGQFVAKVFGGGVWSIVIR